MDLLTRNVAANFSAGEDIRAVSFPWSRAGAEALKRDFCAGGCFDMIVCCDCVYVPLYGDSWKALLEAIDASHATSSPQLHLLDICSMSCDSTPLISTQI